MRWLSYLTVSLIANVLVASAISTGRDTTVVPVMPALKVSLNALAAPAPQPAIPEAAPPEPVPVRENRIVTQDVAEKKISEAVPVQEIEPEPVVREASEKPAQPQPEPKPVKKVEQVAKAEPTKVEPPEEEPLEKKVEEVVDVTAAATNRGKSASTTIHEASYRHQVPPVYPRRAVRMGQQGLVLLHARVAPDGRAEELKIARTSGHRLLDLAALAAVKDWEFEPTNVDGTAVTSWVRVPVNFVLQ